MAPIRASWLRVLWFRVFWPAAQEHHAILGVQAAPEVNELRYVLVPKRMGDAQFWQVYFALAKKLLPPVAFDPSFVPPPSDEHRMTLHDLQVAPPPGTWHHHFVPHALQPMLYWLSQRLSSQME